MDISRPPHHHLLGDVADLSDPRWAPQSATHTRPSASRRGTMSCDEQSGERADTSIPSILSGPRRSPEHRSTSRSACGPSGPRAIFQGPRDTSALMTRHERSLGGAATDRHPRGASDALNIRDQATGQPDRAAARFFIQNRGSQATFRSINRDDSCSVVPSGSLPSTRAGGLTRSTRNRLLVIRRIDAILRTRRTYAHQRTTREVASTPNHSA